MKNGQDSSSDSEKTIIDSLVPTSVGFGEQREVGSGKIVPPVSEEDSSDSERTHTALHGQISRDDDGLGDYFEADSGHKKAGITAKPHGAERKSCFRSVPNNGHQDYYIGASSGSGQAQDQVVCTHAGATSLNIVVPQHQVQNKRTNLDLPPWLIDYKINLDVWLHWEVQGIGRKDKYYSHKDYARTFRSKREVTEFLATGECNGKVVRKKRSADPSGQDSGPSRSTRTRPQTASTSFITHQDTLLSNREGAASNSRNLPHGFV